MEGISKVNHAKQLDVSLYEHDKTKESEEEKADLFKICENSES